MAQRGRHPAPVRKVAVGLGAPGAAALVVLAALDLLALDTALLGLAVTAILAIGLAVPLARDLAGLSRYGEALAKDSEAAPPAFSGWEPTKEIAVRFRHLARVLRIREETLRQGMAASEMVFDALPQPLILIDNERRVVRVNRAARSLIGFDPVGGDLAQAFRDPRLLDTASEAIGLQAARAVNVTLRDATERFFSFQIEPLPRISDEGASFIIVLFDLTERRRAEQMRADFVANASHELRTPLATLIGFIETLQGPARGDAAAHEEFLALMHQQAERMARLVQDLLALSAIELVEHTAPEDRVDLGPVVREVAALMRIEAGRNDMEIHVDAPGDLPPVAGDADQLGQLVQNLVANAVKYGRPETEIRIVARHEELPPPAMIRQLNGRNAENRGNGVVRISVIDQGEGIAPEHLPRLTERFYRVDTARSRAVGGTGLGLAIVKHIVNRHRGLLEIESKLGAGSTFHVVLPARPKDSPKNSAAAGSHANPPDSAPD